MKRRRNNSMTLVRLTLGLLLMILFAGSSFVIESAALAEDSIPSFIAEGTVSWEGFRFDGTNTVIDSNNEGSFLFLYTNGIWEVQFTYKTNSYAGSPAINKMAGLMIDDLRIPDGMREIITYPTNALPSGVDYAAIHLRPSAIATTNTFPAWDKQGLFLPWLSLCPDAELPLVNSTFMRVRFETELLNNPKNLGRFTLSYIEPEKHFLSGLVVTNDGILFLVDGSTMELPAPYRMGYPQFLYEVLETTNYNGMNFPLNAVLKQFFPTSIAKTVTSADIYPVIVSRLHVDQIEENGVNQRHLFLTQAPTNLVALDHRPAGLNNGVTVNYKIISNQWPSLADSRLQSRAKIVEKMPYNQISEETKTGRNRAVVFAIFALTTLSLIILTWKISGKKHK